MELEEVAGPSNSKAPPKKRGSLWLKVEQTPAGVQDDSRVLPETPLMSSPPSSPPLPAASSWEAQPEGYFTLEDHSHITASRARAELSALDFDREGASEEHPVLENREIIAEAYPQTTSALDYGWATPSQTNPYLLNHLHTGEHVPPTTQHVPQLEGQGYRLLRPETRQTLSSRGPNSPAFFPIRSPQKPLRPDPHITCPEYAARTIEELLPFRRPERPRHHTKKSRTPPSYIVSGFWQTTHKTHRKRCARTQIHKLIRLGHVSSEAGVVRHMVYNAKSEDSEHILTILQTTEMDLGALSSRKNHLRIIEKLSSRPHSGIAVFEDALMGELSDKSIRYLEVRTCSFSVTFLIAYNILNSTLRRELWRPGKAQ